MKIPLSSFRQKLQENFSDLSGDEFSQEISSPLLNMLPEVVRTSINKNMPILPRLSLEMTREDQQNLADHCLALMACAVAERGHFTVYDYETMLEYCKDIFGEEAMHARFQAKLHAYLLRDYSQEDVRFKALEDFRIYLNKYSSDINLTQNVLDSIYTAIHELTLYEERQKYNIQSRFFEEVELLFMEFDVHKKKKKLFSQNDEKKQTFLSNTKGSASSAKSKGLFDKLKNLSKIEEMGLFSFAKEQNTEIFHGEELENLENYALAFRDSTLLEQIQAFRSLLIPQDFRIVVLGEGKRGKSSLINALLGQNILPTRAIIPETGTLVELYYSPVNTYEIEWINEQEFEELENILYAEEFNILLQKKFENLKQVFNNKELFANLQSITINRPEDLHEFISADGLYTSLIKKVRIGINSENIPKGILIVDTPAINASDPFYHILTKEECLKADCLIFMLDARKPDSYTEIQLLKELATKGRALDLIGVLSHPSDSQSERELAKKRALETLSEGIRSVEAINLINVFLFNPKEIIEIYEKNTSLVGYVHKQSFDKDYLNFVDSITQVIRKDVHSSVFNERLEATFTHLMSFAQTNKSLVDEQYRKSLPSDNHKEVLRKHAEHLAFATEEYADHARSLILSAIHDINEWRVNSERSISLLEERIVLHISKAMHNYADSLGNDFAKESAWENFDENESSRIARSLLDEFTAEQRADLNAWEEKIQLFNDSMQEISSQCFAEIQKSSADLKILTSTNSKFDHLLVKTFSHMAKLTLFLSGTGTGLLASTGVVNILALGTATLAFLSSPIIIPSAILIGGAAYVLRSFGNPQKRKENFLQRKEDKLREFSKQISKNLNEQLDKIQEELMLGYSQAVHKSLAPALEIMASEAVNIHLYLEVIDKQQKQLSQ